MIDKRKSYYAIVDTETTNGLDNPLVYDLGLVISDKKGNVVFSKQWLIEEIITNKKRMRSAYYAKKLPLYRSLWKKNKSMLVKFAQAKAEFNRALEQYNVRYITAYNLQFDIKALKYTNYKLDYPSVGWGMCRFIENDYEYIDIWSFACETILKTPTYRWYADTYGWYSEKGNMITNAEKAFAFISKNPDYIEDHLALADCFIEKEILVKCLRQHKKYTKNNFVVNPWRLVQNPT